MKKITVYSTESCHFCHMEKEFLNAHNVAFTDHVITPDDQKTREYLMDLTGQMGVPVTVITDIDQPDVQPDVIVGFSEGLFMEKLGLHDDVKMAA